MQLSDAERVLWVATLETEERERLQSLKASMGGLEREGAPAPEQINALLVSAFEAQTTLLRMSRVFPARSDNRRLDLEKALKHRPTMELAWQLYRCWRALGVTAATQKLILRDALLAASTKTASIRSRLFVNLQKNWKRGIDRNAHAGFAAEGSGQARV